MCELGFLEPISLWRDTLLSRDTGLLPQLDMPDFVDSPREALLFLRSGLGFGGEMVAGEWEEGSEGELWLV